MRNPKLAGSLVITIPDSDDFSFRINPYTRWVHEHPERLLSDPRPELLENRRRCHPSDRVLVELGSGSGNFLLQLADLPPSPAEQVEKLEQLRVLSAGHSIQVGLIDEPTAGIDTPDDYRAFVQRVANRHGAPPPPKRIGGRSKTAMPVA